MKLIQIAAIGAGLFTSATLHAQQADQDSVLKSENAKQEYKSKEWKQGPDVVSDTTKGAGVKGKKTKRPQKPVPPPPPPPAPTPPAKQ